MKFDLDQAAKFLFAIDPTATDFCFRTFTDDPRKRERYREINKKDPLARKLIGSLKECANELKKQNKKGAGIFVVINAGGQRKEEIERVRAAFADLDRPGAPLNVSGLPKSHIIVESSHGKRHVYWRVKDLPVEHFKRLQRLIIVRLGSDPNVIDLPRVMRLPGFFHRKIKGKSQRVRIVKISEHAAYTAAELFSAFGEKSFAEQSAQVGKVTAGRHDDLLRLTHDIASMAQKRKWSRDEALAMLQGAATERYQGRIIPDDEIARAYDGATKKLEAGTLKPTVASDNRTPIELRQSHVHEAVDSAENALIASEVEIYQRGSQLVFPSDHFHDGSNDRSKSPPTLNTVTPPWLMDSLRRIARCVKVDVQADGATRTRTIDWPSVIASGVLARVDKWKFPELLGMIQTPLLREDGSVCTKPGYDPNTKLIIAIQDDWPAIPKSPTREDAVAALKLLKRLIRSFPFRTRADRAVMLSAMLTAIVRPSLKIAPMHAFNSPLAGAGKSKAANICAILATGRPAAALVWSPKGDEAEKRLGAALLQGNSIVSFDNVQHPLDGELLCSVLTLEHVLIRVLGQSKVVDIPVAATFLANGNNLEVHGDTVRRVLVAVIDPKCENPELRHFDKDPVVVATKRRVKLVNAALTILSAYIQSGIRIKCSALGNYDEWSGLVRSALLWLDCEDPVKVMARTRVDKDKRALHGLMLAWHNEFGSKVMKAAEVIEAAGERPEPKCKPLYEALELVGNGPNMKPNAKSFGKYLAANKDKPVNGRCIREIEDKHDKILRWTVMKSTK